MYSASFCQKNHGVTFPLMKKSDVNGPNTNEVFAYLKSEKKSMMMEKILWNFKWVTLVVLRPERR